MNVEKRKCRQVGRTEMGPQTEEMARDTWIPPLPWTWASRTTGHPEGLHWNALEGMGGGTGSLFRIGVNIVDAKQSLVGRSGIGRGTDTGETVR